jgi:predicted DCC family thiol-disulfide oxidoreductase YuxK
MSNARKRGVTPEERRPLPNDNPRHVILFDGLCALCHGFVRWMLRRDRRGHFAFAPLQGPTAMAVLARHTQLTGADSLVLVLSVGSTAERALLRSEAVIAAGRELGGAWRVMASLASVVPRRWRDRMYDFVAARRYRTFGQYDACPLPPPAARVRFLE